MEKTYLFFDLGEYGPENAFFVQGSGKKQELTSYAIAQEKWTEHQKVNPALALVSDTHKHKLTHFIEDIELPEDRISRLSVISPAKNPSDILPDLIAVFFYIPAKAYRRALQRSGHKKAAHPQVLKYLGVEEHQLTGMDPASHVDIRTAARLIVQPPKEIAKSLVFHHPEIYTINPDIATHIYTNYLRLGHNSNYLLIHYTTA